MLVQAGRTGHDIMDIRRFPKMPLENNWRKQDKTNTNNTEQKVQNETIRMEVGKRPQRHNIPNPDMIDKPLCTKHVLCSENGTVIPWPSSYPNWMPGDSWD